MEPYIHTLISQRDWNGRGCVTVSLNGFDALELIGLFLGWVFPYISYIHTAYIREYLQFRYLKCLVTVFPV